MCTLQIGLSLWTLGQGSTLWCEPNEYLLRPSSSQLAATGPRLGTSPRALQSATPSRVSLRPRSTLLEQESPAFPPSSSHGHRRAGAGELGGGIGGGRALRACMALRSHHRWRCRVHSSGTTEETWRPADCYARGVSPRGHGGRWQPWRRGDYFWPILHMPSPSNHLGQWCHRNHRHRCRRQGGGLPGRCGSLHKELRGGGGDCIWLRCRPSLCPPFGGHAHGFGGSMGRRSDSSENGLLYPCRGSGHPRFVLRSRNSRGRNSLTHCCQTENQKTRGKSSFRWRRRRTRAKAQEGDNGIPCCRSGLSDVDFASSYQPDFNPCPETRSHRGQDDIRLCSEQSPPISTLRRIISLDSAIRFDRSQGVINAPQDTAPSGPWYVGFPYFADTSRGCRIGEREAGGTESVYPYFRRCLSSSGASSVQSPYNSGGSDCLSFLRPNGGVDSSRWCWNSRCCWQEQTSSRTGLTPGHVFPVGDGLNGEANDANFISRCYTNGVAFPWNFWSSVLGTVWRVRPEPGAGSASIPSHDNVRFSHGRQHPSGKRHFGPDGGCNRTDELGWWPVRSGNLALSSGGPAIEHICQPPPVDNQQSQSLCPVSRPTMDHMCFGLPERIGGHLSQTFGTGECKDVPSHQSTRSLTEAKGKSKPKEAWQVPAKATARGRGVRHPTRVDERPTSSSFNNIPRGLESNPLDGTMNFATWAICLPRWILATKTPFSWALLRSFSARRWTGSPSTTTFPLPAPYLGCFGSGIPISRSTSFQKAAMKRLLHIIVCALDYLYLGRFPNVRELERRPNGLQRAAFKRLWSLLVVCSQSQDEFPMFPGRFGPELGAALVQLEEFLAKRRNEKFEENPHLLPSDKYPQLQPYKNLDVSRLEIVGSGSWPMMDLIDGPLWLPYQEPPFLLHGLSTESAPGLNFKGESRDENIALAKIWDARGIPLFRRCLTSVVDDLFALGICGPQESQRNEIFKMPKKVAQELQMLAALAPLNSTNMAVNYLGAAFVGDVSHGKGAVVSTPIDCELSELLWLGSDKRGGFCLLDEPARHFQAAAGIEIDFGLPGHGHEEEQADGPFRAPLLYFDFVEFCGGSGRVTACCRGLGLSVAPPLDLSNSQHYDMTDMRFLEWALFMIQEKRFRSFMLAPPCTTCSPAAWPAVRSYAEPLGFDRKNEKTFLGNPLSFKSFVLRRAGKRARTPNMLEQPRRSKIAWLRFWRNLLEPGFAEAVVASRQFGSPHKKEFRLLTYLIDCNGLEVRCPGGHNHLKVEGMVTKASAIYTWDLAMHFARSFANSPHLLEAAEAFDGKPNSGLESTDFNDILTSRQWWHESCWSWKRRSHINVPEANAAVAMLERVARSYSEVRFPVLMDSRVAKCVLAKGRSTARSLQPTCRRAGAIQFAFGFYPGWDFAPTRLNPADDPTRHSAIRAPSDRSWISYCPNTTLQMVHHVRLSWWAANWLRLCLLLLSTGAQACGVPDPALSALAAPYLWISPTAIWIPTTTEAATLALSPVTALYFWILPVDAWISAPGGCSSTFPLLLLLVFLVGVLSVCFLPSRCCLVFRSSFGLGPRSKRWCALTFIFALLIPAVEAPMAPTTATETRRAATRHQTELIATRVVRKKTLEARQELLNEFQVWLAVEHSVMLTQLLTAKPPDAEEICRWLVEYGKALFQSGKAYGRFAETINAVASARPHVRKQLTGAWDLAFAWLADEPGQHHPALPLSVMLAMLAVSLMWGWPREAAVIGMAWSGIMRIGEVLLADRKDLILPSDSAPGIDFALVRIHAPKTRGRSAKHQTARIDPRDIVQLLQGVYQRVPKDEKLWPYSSATLRKRFNNLLAELGLPTDHHGGSRPFDLGSLRPGGATHLLLLTESPDLVRRRGRWISNRVCEIYLQEVIYTTFTEQLNPQVKTRIHSYAAVFPKVLQIALGFLNTAIPPPVWPLLFRAHNVEELG